MRKLLLGLILLTVGCTTKDPSPAAVAVFTPSRSVIETNEAVSFANTSQNAARYEWNFGNGQTSTSPTPSATYSTVGTYTVTLTAYNGDDKSVTTTQKVKVGKRYIRRITLTAIDPLDAGGTLWDRDGTGPDISLGYRTPALRTTNFVPVDDLRPQNLPFTWGFSPQDEELTQGTWTFQLRDFDFSAPAEYVAMYSWSMPIGPPPSNRDAIGNGSYTLTGPATNPGLWNLVIEFETK
ncbi:PKD domain-containing protein [Hymenobacter sp. BT175]|uniref:PKD domain-containing protein n=1 Tax=Hymenobacter translucens TaxID=2886507 RepID=UPI001D0E451F|nr:PKD domain-containing protein [Hymenobacter translucens]